MMSKIPLYYHEKYGEYRFGKFHPFNPKRFPDFVELVRETPEMDSIIEIMESPRANDETLETVHKKNYIERVARLEKNNGNLTMDTPVLKGTPDAGRRIVGGSLEAARNIEKGKTIINLGGLHHAGPDYGEGFCIFNDVAVAAQHLVDDGKTVCIFDTDAHQGNGTMDIFYESSKVLFISIHQDPSTLYPGRGYIREIGHNAGEGFTVNIPMPRDANITEYDYAIKNVAKPIVTQFNPEVIIRNGGSDPHQSDSLTDLALDMRGLEYLGKVSREMANESNSGYIDLMLSGYGLRVVEGWQAITKGSLDLDIPLPSDQKIGEIGHEPKKQLKKEMDDLKHILSDYWDL